MLYRTAHAATLLLAALACVLALGVAPAAASSPQNVSAVTLSSHAGGAQHVRYGFAFTTSGTGALTSPGTITITAPAGTALSTSVQLHDDTSNATVFAGAALSNGGATVTLTLSGGQSIPAGHTVTVTLNDVDNPPAGGSLALDVSTSSDTTAVQTPTYTLTPAQQITGLTAPTVTSAAGGAKHVRYSFEFTTGSSTGGLVSPGTITIAAPAGTTLSTSAQIHDDTSNSTVFAGAGLSNGGATVTLTLSGGQSIPAGHAVTVTLNDVTNPPAGAGYALQVSTSSDPAPVQSPSYAFTAAQQITGLSKPTVSSSAGGAKHVRYSFGFTTGSTTGGLVNPGTITIAAPAGTTLSTSAQIHDDTSDATVFAGAALSNGGATVTLTLSGGQSIPAAHAVTVTLNDVTNPPGGGGYALDVSTSSDPAPVQSPSYGFTAAQQITGLSAPTISSSAGGAKHVRYGFEFTTGSTTGGLVNPGTITIAAPAGTTLSTSVNILDTTSNTTVFAGAALSNGGATVTLTLSGGQSVPPGHTLRITLNDVTNPSPGGGYALKVSTSSDPAPVQGPSYAFTAAQQVTGLTPVAAAIDLNAEVNDTFSLTTSASTGGLVNPGTITIAAPAGTTLSTSVNILDTTSTSTVFAGAALSNGGATITLTLSGGQFVPAGHTLRITLEDVVNPAAGPGPFDVSTSSDPVVARTPDAPPPGPPAGEPPADQPPADQPPVTPPAPPVEEPPVAVPPPVVGKTAAVVPEKGAVLVKLPGQQKFVQLSGLASIPVGATLDTRRGQVSLTTAVDAGGKTQVGHFSQGLFVVQQGRKNPLTTIRMTGGGLTSCKTRLPRGGSAKPVSAAGRSRRLFSNVRGRFRTRGRNSSATVRGTKWLLKETCAGTLTRVSRGAVMVRDFRRKRNTLVKAGHSYFARAAPLRERR